MRAVIPWLSMRLAGKLLQGLVSDISQQASKVLFKTLLVKVWWSTPVFPTPKRLMEKDSEFEARLKYFLRSCAPPIENSLKS